MSRIGIYKNYSEGSAPSDLTALFGLLKTMIVDAGFNVITNTASRIEFMPAGTTPAADTGDDTPHWTLYLNGTTEIRAAALHGLAWDDAGVRTGSPATAIAASPQFWDPVDEAWYDSRLQIWAAADAREGWFWIVSMVWEADDSQEVYDVYQAVTAGTKARRLAADLTGDNMARYGLFTAAGTYLPAYARDNAGALAVPSLGWWSPLCANGNGVKRRAASGLAQLVAPCYPLVATPALTASLSGELESVMIATDGYAQHGDAIPGWRTYRADISPQKAPLALPAPATFATV
jgi:hypothetical protein